MPSATESASQGDQRRDALWTLSIALVGATFALVVAMFATDALYGVLPDSLPWGGLAIILAPMWISMAVWGPAARSPRMAVTVGLAAVALPGLLPVDLLTLERVTIALLAGVIYIAFLWVLGRLAAVRGAWFGVVAGSVVLVAIGLVPGVAELVNSDLVASAYVAIGATAGVLLIAVAGLAMHGWTTPREPAGFVVAGWLITAVILVNGVAATISRM